MSPVSEGQATAFSTLKEELGESWRLSVMLRVTCQLVTWLSLELHGL